MAAPPGGLTAGHLALQTFPRAKRARLFPRSINLRLSLGAFVIEGRSLRPLRGGNVTNVPRCVGEFALPLPTCFGLNFNYRGWGYFISD
jgi:hypothetical protein